MPSIFPWILLNEIAKKEIKLITKSKKKVRKRRCRMKESIKNYE
jgi:hypothetical protein